MLSWRLPVAAVGGERPLVHHLAGLAWRTAGSLSRCCPVGCRSQRSATAWLRRQGEVVFLVTQMRCVFAGGVRPTARLPSPLWRWTRERVLPRGAKNEEEGAEGGGEVLAASLSSECWTSSPLEDIY